jgi:hypothetical protein
VAGGFDELWATYRFKHDRAKAKVAYAKLDPSPELHAELCAAAEAWADHYETNGIEPRWRVRLHNWLTGEKYLEDTPQVYADAKSAAISKTRGSAKAKPTKPTGEASRGLNLNIKRFKITDHQTEGSAFSDFYEIFTFEGEDGSQFTERMHVLKADTLNADDAPDYYLSKKLGQAAFGRGNPIGEWVGRVVGINGDSDGIMFHHLPEENVAPEPVADPRVQSDTPTRTARPLTPTEQRQCDEAFEAWCAEQDDAA